MQKPKRPRRPSPPKEPIEINWITVSESMGDECFISNDDLSDIVKDGLNLSIEISYDDFEIFKYKTEKITDANYDKKMITYRQKEIDFLDKIKEHDLKIKQYNRELKAYEKTLEDKEFKRFLELKEKYDNRPD